MGSNEIQKGLMLLSSDVELREQFFRDPLKVGSELGLSNAETRRLAQLSAPQLRTLGSSPHNRRFLEVCKVLPLTHRALKESFTAHFKQFAATHAPGELRRHLGDNLAFALHLERELRGQQKTLEPRWALDLLSYERARLQAADPARRMVVQLFRHDISRLVRSLARREEVPAAVSQLSVAVWWRPRRRGNVRYAVITLSSPKVRRRTQAK